MLKKLPIYLKLYSSHGKKDEPLSIKTLSLFILRKLGKLVSLLIIISIVAFLLISSSPVDPIRSYIGADLTIISPEQRENIEAYWGLNEPKISQYFHWGLALLQGNFGTSLLYRVPVLDVIAERFFPSFFLMGAAWILSGILGFLLGIIAGLNEGKWIDRLIKGYCFILSSTPAFWLGLLLLMIFSVWLNLLPIGLGSPAGILTEDVTLGDRIKHMVLPALTLSIVGVGNIALHTREKLIDCFSSDYILFARAAGKSTFQIIWQHGLRNISLPAISLHFASFGELFGGAVLAEQIFSYPGLGQTIVQAGLGGDVPLFLGIVLFSTLFVFAGNTIADLLYKTIDPRIGKGEAK